MKRPVIVADDAIPYLRERLEPLCELRLRPGGAISRADLIDADALLTRTRTHCDRALLEGTSVKLVATATIGTDHIDIPALEALGIEVRNAPGCNAPAVAQYVWSALLRLGFDPATQTLGVVGKGHVGSIVADWGRRLGARVIVSDPPRAEEGMTDEDYLPLRQLMSEADAVTFHTPLTHDGTHPTFHLADEEALGCLKPGAIVVNAARGGVVDEAGLLQVMQDRGVLAAIDTWEGEPHLNPYLLQQATFATPHIAGYSSEGKQRATRMALESLRDVLGIAPSTEGLCGPYEPPTSLTEASIISSYDPAADTTLLRASRGDFELLRKKYPLRPEVQ